MCMGLPRWVVVVVALLLLACALRRRPPTELRRSVGDALPGARVSPTTLVTGPRTFHRFFDSSPFSPSGRYLAALRAPREGPADVAPGETAVVVVVDLEAPGGPRVVRERPTRAWDGQLGAQVQWGASDDVVYCNDLDRDGAVAGVAYRWRENASEALPAPVYHVSRDGAWAASPADLGALRLTQPGYGVVPTPKARRRGG